MSSALQNRIVTTGPPRKFPCFLSILLNLQNLYHLFPSLILIAVIAPSIICLSIPSIHLFLHYPAFKSPKTGMQGKKKKDLVLALGSSSLICFFIVQIALGVVFPSLTVSSLKVKEELFFDTHRRLKDLLFSGLLEL